MPAYGWLAGFRRDFARLSPSRQAAFLAAISQFVDDLRSGAGFRKGLRVKGIKGAAGVYEMTWAPDGRATFEHGDEVVDGEPHIVWRRVGTHDVFARP